MSVRQPAAPQGATGRADLLRLLAIVPRDRMALDDGAGGWFGYERRERELLPVELPVSIVAPPPAPVAADPAADLPLQMPFVLAIVRRERRQPAVPHDEEDAANTTSGTFDEDRLRPCEERRLVNHEDLVPWPRVLPALRRQLGSQRTGQLDLARLATQLASGRVPGRLPRRVHERWHPDLVVVLDFSARLWPYREDMHRLAERLVCLVGRSRVSLRVLSEGPFAPWTDWLDHQHRRTAAPPAERPWAMPLAGTPVLLVTDGGLLLGPDSDVARAWARFASALARAQVRPLALMPVSTHHLHPGLCVPLLRWSADARLRPTRVRACTAVAEPPGLADFLAMAAMVRRIDAPLLRALRQRTPDAPLDAGLEGALWCHPDVDASFTASVRPEAAPPHRQRFAERLIPLQAAVDRLRRRHHAHLNRALDHEELLLWDGHADPALPRDAAAVENTLAFFRDLARALSAPGSDVPASWARLAEGFLERSDEGMRRRHGAVYDRLAAAVAKFDPTALPGWADPAALAPWLAGERSGGVAVLVRDAATGALALEDGGVSPRQSPLGASLAFDAGGIAVRVGGAARSDFLWAEDLPRTLAPLADPAATVHIETAAETIEVAAVRRPRGAIAWRCWLDGIVVESAPIAGHAARWRADMLSAVFRARPDEQGYWALRGDAIDAADFLAFGLDERFGVYADLTVSTGHGTAMQRFRWIEVGSFWMGSPADEAERLGDEGPRHPVTLTRGFWLADTACTQALWQAVMGENPSRFTGKQRRPVESVSWYEVRGFLRELEAKVPGCVADLPTEAEWEYACRAGTDTPFSFGAQITPGQVNYDGNYPYAGGKKGFYCEQTLPVKSLPPNPWGLYEMHGNIYEWCADGPRVYDDKPQADPRGTVRDRDDTRRAVRGGSWFVLAGRARSACRHASGAGFAEFDLGFRVCLRSGEPSPTGSRPGESGIFSRLADRFRRTKKF